MREGMKMENEIEENDAMSLGRFGDLGRLFIAPMAILIALIGGMIFGLSIDMNDFVVPLVVLGCASVIATAPIFGEKFIGDKLSSSLFTTIILLSVIVAGSFVASIFSGVVGFLFTICAVIGLICVKSNRNEEYVILTFSIIGFYAAKLLASGIAQRKCISLECGLQNGTLAVFVSSQLFDEIVYMIPTAAYALVMFVTSLAFVYFVRKIN